MKKKIDRQEAQALIDQSRQQRFTGSLGTVISYDKYKNTATVVISDSDTDQIQEVLHNVPCPYYPGVQMVAPEPGLPCWVMFKGGNLTQPIISHYYNHRYEEFVYDRQTKTPFSLPTHLMG